MADSVRADPYIFAFSQGFLDVRDSRVFVRVLVRFYMPKSCLP